MKVGLCLPILIGAIRAASTFLLSKGHSAFPDQRTALCSSRFQHAENPLLCPSGVKGAHVAGKFGGLLAIICRFKTTEDCLVELVESEPFSTPNPVEKLHVDLMNLISHCRLCGNNVSVNALAISHQGVTAARGPHNRAAAGI